MFDCIADAKKKTKRKWLKEKGKQRAVSVFANNVKSLLLCSPLRAKAILAIDPGFKHGCKLALIDAKGTVLSTDTVFPHPPQNEKEKACDTIIKLMQSHGCSICVIGNGTACRETEKLVPILKRKVQDFQYTIVNEAGASVYSASKLAEQELPELSIAVRSAVSLARR